MTDGTTRVLVVCDEAGEIYVLTDEALAVFRVTSEQRAAIEAALGDVQGFLTPIPIPRSTSAPLLRGNGVGDFSAVQLLLPRAPVDARPAIGPRPGV